MGRLGPGFATLYPPLFILCLLVSILTTEVFEDETVSLWDLFLALVDDNTRFFVDGGTLTLLSARNMVSPLLPPHAAPSTR